MRAVIQRVSEASVVVEDEKVANIQQGLLVLLGIEIEDAKEENWNRLSIVILESWILIKNQENQEKLNYNFYIFNLP